MTSSTTDKIKGVANEAAGNVKQGVGKAVGNDRLQAEGAAQEIKGETQQAVGKAKDKVKDTADKLRDSAHRNL
ncbi:CsbD family protein [Mesorhizobium sp. BR1-1-16]|uniref:CsbD family protein n=1 Tax=Mesorhizobium sp. BR1-1-16 TaxID=2876653 RepID=UPI001CCC1C0D|nr:CsbD family protein [Mesorhizobium sp. BR1-1-16]MBZ9936243.1 CsbD family protein [Mesorhizobium sp. BR1-1-16]